MNESAQTLQKSQSLGASDRGVSDVEVKDTLTAQVSWKPVTPAARKGRF